MADVMRRDSGAQVCVRSAKDAQRAVTRRRRLCAAMVCASRPRQRVQDSNQRCDAVVAVENAWKRSAPYAQIGLFRVAAETARSGGPRA